MVNDEQKYSDDEQSRWLGHLYHGKKDSTDRDILHKRYINKNEKKKEDGVKPVKKVRSDLEALKDLISYEQPTSRIFIEYNIFVVRYGFEDPLGNGFRATWNRQIK